MTTLTLTLVSSYDSLGNPLYYDRTHKLGNIVLERSSGLLKQTTNITQQSDIIQAKSRVTQVGRISITLDNSDGIWSDYFSLNEKGHRLTIRNSQGRIAWVGFSRDIVAPSNPAELKVDFVHEFDRLDDFSIRQYPDGSECLPISSDVIFEELRSLGISELPSPDAEQRVYRPLKTVSARTYLNALLYGLGMTLVNDEDSNWLIRPVRNDDAPKATITEEDVMDLSLMDPKKKMYNQVNFSYFDPVECKVNTSVYRGGQSDLNLAESYRTVYGLRELTLDCSMFELENAQGICQDTLALASTPRRRLSFVTSDTIKLSLGDKVVIDMSHVNDTPDCIVGIFSIVGISVDVENQRIKYEVAEEFI